MVARRRAVWWDTKEEAEDPSSVIQNTAGWLLSFEQQESSGAVSLAENIAVALGRNIALLTYADYTANANWTNPSGEIARHGAGSVETLQQDDILAPGKTFQVTITVANRTAGSVTITNGGAAISANEETTRTITSTGTDFIITPTTDFDGDIDVAIILVQQTSIAASTAFPGSELFVTPNAASDPAGNEADATTGFTPATATITSESSIKHAGTYSIKGVFSGANSRFAYNLDNLGLVDGRSYRLSLWRRHIGTASGDGAARIGLGSGTSTDVTVLDNFTKADVTFSQIIHNYVHSDDTKWLTFREFNAENDGGVYIDNISITETNPLNGDDTGTTPGVAMGDYLSKTDDGATSFTELGLVEYNSMINPVQFHIGMAIQKAVWDTTERYFISFIIDASNWIKIGGTATAGQLVYEIRAGGETEQILHASGSPTGIIMPSVLSKGGTMKAFLGSTQFGGDVAIANTLTGNFVTMIIGAQNATPTNVNLANRNYYWHYSDEKSSAELAEIANSIGASQ